MKRRVLLGLVAGLEVAGALAQTHAVKKPETVVRAVAVYEYTGEEAKVTASRVVPVSLFINGQLQDAGVYLAQPVPFALDTGTVYEAERAGVGDGTLEMAYERHLTSGDTAEIDDGWLGYGALKPKPKETLAAKKQSGPLPKIIASSDRPHFAGKTPGASSGADGGAKSSGTGNSGTGSSGAGSSGTGTTSTSDSDSTASDPDRPSFHRRPSSGGDDSSTGSSSTASTSTTPAGSGSTTASTGGSGSGSDGDDAAERPTLKRRTPAEIKADQKKKDSAKVIAGNNLNDDPDRPTLHRGSATHLEEEEIPPLRGLPKDMKQMVAVSDAKDRSEHEFARAWESEAERVEVLGKMQAFARSQLAAYKGVASAAAPATAAPTAPAKTATTHTAAASRAKKAAAPAAPTLVLTDESLKGYTLSYGGAATYVYTATSPGANGVSRYVTVVAQQEPIEGLKLALGSVTDSSHLDRTPWMRLVDVVDADASNRASLLMELRAQHTRQFALYRVIGAEANQVFVTGSTE